MIDQNLKNISYFFSRPNEYLKQAATAMLADRLLPGINECMGDVNISKPEVEHSYRIFLALERERD